MSAGPEAFLPTPSQTLFLRACLLDTRPARQAWDEWISGATQDGTPPRHALAPFKALLPLLAWNLARHGAPIDSVLRTHFHSAQLTEELRWDKYRDICDHAFSILRNAGLPFVALKGAVLGELVYPQPFFRHADDIDVLVAEADLDRAADALTQAGWRTRDAGSALASPKHRPPLVHPEGVTIELHWRLTIPDHSLPHHDLWARSREATIRRAPVRVLSDADLLLHAIAHGMTDRPDLRWVADSWFILAARPGIDWQVFLETTQAARLDFPFSYGARYLRESMGAPIPDDVMSTLAARAARTGVMGRAAAKPWPIRRAFPPPLQFAVHYGVPVWSVPFYYAYRIARYLRRQRPERSVRQPPSAVETIK